MSGKLRSLVLAAAVLSTVGGCSSGAYYYDPYVYDTYYWYGYDSAYYYTYYDPYYGYYYDPFYYKPQDMSVNADVLAARTAEGVPAYYEPAGCVNATSAGATATIVLTDCTSGPFGMRNVSGTLMATFSIDTATGALSVATSSSGLRVNGRTAEFSGNATSTETPTGRSFIGNSRGAVVGNFGNRLERTSQIQVQWQPGTGCFTIDGSGDLVSDGTTYTTQLAGVQKCRGQCATAGTLTIDGPDREVVVTFDGSSTPPVTASDTSEEGTVDLACQAQ